MLNHPIRLFQILINKTKGYIVAKAQKVKKTVSGPSRADKRQATIKAQREEGGRKISIILNCSNGQSADEMVRILKASLKINLPSGDKYEFKSK